MTGDVTLAYLKRLSFDPDNVHPTGTLIAGQDYFNVCFSGGTLDGVDIGFNDPPTGIFDSVNAIDEADISELFVSDGATIGGGAIITGSMTLDELFMTETISVGTFIIDAMDAPATATGTTQSTAYAIACDITYFGTVGSGSGAQLPTGSPGSKCRIYNFGANTLKVYPNTGSGGTIDGGAANASVNLSTTSRGADFVAIEQDVWISNVIGAKST